MMTDVAGIAKKGLVFVFCDNTYHKHNKPATLSTHLPCHSCSLCEVFLVNLRQALVDDRGLQSTEKLSEGISAASPFICVQQFDLYGNNTCLQHHHESHCHHDHDSSHAQPPVSIVSSLETLHFNYNKPCQVDFVCIAGNIVCQSHTILQTKSDN